MESKKYLESRFLILEFFPPSLHLTFNLHFTFILHLTFLHLTIYILHLTFNLQAQFTFDFQLLISIEKAVTLS